MNRPTRSPKTALCAAAFAWICAGGPASAGTPLDCRSNAESCRLGVHVGPVATRGTLPQLYDSAKPIVSIMSRSDHIARTKLTSIRLVFTNLTGPGEASNGAPTTLKAGIEYPEGAFAQVRFSHADLGTIVPGGYLVSDPVAVDIPDGARFWVRSLENNKAGIAVESNIDPSVGDGSNFSAASIDSQADLTTTVGAIARSPIGITPTAIVGQTTLPGICLVGDSRIAGLGDTPTDGLPDVGNFARTIGTALPYIDLGWSGEKASDFVSGHTVRVAIADAYCTHVINEMGINDLAGGSSLPALSKNMAAIASYFAGKPIGTATLEPVTVSTDKWATLANQRPNARLEYLRVAYNASLRKTPPSWATLGIFDIASAVESAPNSGLWKPHFTADGVHASFVGARAIRASGVVDIRRFSTIDSPRPAIERQ